MQYVPSVFKRENEIKRKQNSGLNSRRGMAESTSSPLIRLFDKYSVNIHNEKNVII